MHSSAISVEDGSVLYSKYGHKTEKVLKAVLQIQLVSTPCAFHLTEN